MSKKYIIDDASDALKGEFHPQKFIDSDAELASQYVNFSPKGSGTRRIKSVLKTGDVPSPILKSDPSQDTRVPKANIICLFVAFVSPLYRKRLRTNPVILSLNENLVERDKKVTPPEVSKMDSIYDLPVVLKKVRKFDLWSEFDDETAEDYRDFMSWFMQKDDGVLRFIPAKVGKGFFVTEFEESAFNTCDFQNGAPKFDRYGYRIRKVMERVGDLAMQYSCIKSKEGRDGVRKMCKSLVESEFLIEALKAQKGGDMRKAKRLIGRVEECAKVWDEWNPS